MRLPVLCALLATVVGCTSKPVEPLAPATPAVVVSDMGYDINVPYSATAFYLRRSYPDGINIPPIEAQHRFDYTAEYKGSPNVYYGDTAPNCEYVRVGMVVAPHSVASIESFTSAQWPGIGLTPGIVYQWVGRFVYTLVAPDDSYVPDNGVRCN